MVYPLFTGGFGLIWLCGVVGVCAGWLLFKANGLEEGFNNFILTGTHTAYYQ
ncbi:hypothetical protein [Colwellia sp. 75C3]|uniref:hypothetical protein n=1 Tax=Colwellia sp. 75C3 TaxID=888425 RepID=UPI0012FEF81A|nr:hypothetical protein [Colwellia sp. 75C3]